MNVFGIIVWSCNSKPSLDKVLGSTYITEALTGIIKSNSVGFKLSNLGGLLGFSTWILPFLAWDPESCK